MKFNLQRFNKVKDKVFGIGKTVVNSYAKKFTGQDVPNQAFVNEYKARNAGENPINTIKRIINKKR